MQLSVTFRHMEASDALREYARDKLSRIEKYLDSAVEASVVLSVEKFRHIADVTMICDGLKINGQEQTEDMYSALDMVSDKIERQVKRYRQKVRNKKGKKGVSPKDVVVEAAPPEEDEETRAQVITATQVFVKPMDIDEAVMQLEMTTDPFMVFTNADSEKINVLYRRDDGQYGLIEPMTD